MLFFADVGVGEINTEVVDTKLSSTGFWTSKCVSGVMVSGVRGLMTVVGVHGGSKFFQVVGVMRLAIRSAADGVVLPRLAYSRDFFTVLGSGRF